MKRLLFALIAGAMVFTVAFASAAALNVNGNTIQAGTDTDLACDDNGVNAGWGLETGDNTVRYVRIEGIDPSCFGQELFVKVNSRPGDAQHMTIDNVDETFDLGYGSSPVNYPSPESITSLQVWIEG